MKAGLAFVGGGRWARVLIRAARLALPDVSLSVHSPSNSAGMRAWVREQGWDLPVYDRWPHEVGEFSDVVVANRAREHAAATLAALSCAPAVLVEKPMALTAAAVEQMVRAAEERGRLLCSAHVLSFTRYLSNFVATLPTLPCSLELDWADPAGEVRYGEQRQFDGSISSVHDMMPHILSVLDPVVGGQQVEVERARVERGGAVTLVDLAAGKTRIRVRVERGAPVRRRLLQALCGGAPFALEFSPKPGVIRAAGQESSGDPEWGRGPTPLELLFREFWRSCAERRYCDPRLTPRLASLAAAVCEEVNSQCHAQLAEWLRAEPSADPAERAYAERELAAYSPR